MYRRTIGKASVASESGLGNRAIPSCETRALLYFASGLGRIWNFTA